MTHESQMSKILQDLIMKWGAPDALLSDNAKAETSRNVKKNSLRIWNEGLPD